MKHSSFYAQAGTESYDKMQKTSPDFGPYKNFAPYSFYKIIYVLPV